MMRNIPPYEIVEERENMAESTTNPLVYYATPGLMTDPGAQARILKALPAEISALCQIVQQNLLHIFWAKSYGIILTKEREQEVNIRRASTMLAQIEARDDRLLTVPRPPEKRLVGNCRDFTVLLVTLLRHQGIPARARCGFGTYFRDKLQYVDHWVCEYWNADEDRWIMVDAQVDEVQIKALGITFDPCDMPDDQFLNGGKAWRMARAGEADPDQFGIFDMHGLWFIRGDHVRDVAALNNMEMLPWDDWGVIDAKDADSDETLALLDRAAALTVQPGNESFADLRALYEGDDRLRVAEEAFSEPVG
jgi:hypothetical protein